MRILVRLSIMTALAVAVFAGSVSRGQTPPVPDATSPKAAEKRPAGKQVDRCRQSGSMAARLANYHLQEMPLADLIAEIRESGVEDAPTLKVEKMAAEVYAQRLLPADAFRIYKKSCPFRD